MRGGGGPAVVQMFQVEILNHNHLINRQLISHNHQHNHQPAAQP